MMIVSQGLLALFLSYWLYNQFSTQKQLLLKDINQGLKQAKQQTIDSMMAASFITPFMKDSSRISLMILTDSIVDSTLIWNNHRDRPDSSLHIITKISNNEKSTLIDSIKMANYSNTASYSIDSANSRDINFQRINDSTTKLIFQGMRMLINTVAVKKEGNDSLESYFITKVDTNLYFKLIEDFVKIDYDNFTIVWLNENEFKSTDKGNGILLKTNIFDTHFFLRITDYSLYLIKKISAQIFFVLILLLISSVAFVIAFRSLINQNKLMRLKNDFISNITHELKTPVSTVSVALEALLEFDKINNPQTTREYLQMAIGEVDKLKVLVDQVLKNVALEDDSNFLAKQAINLVELVEDLSNSLEPRLERAGANIKILSDTDEIVINADKTHLSGVFVNLIDNSLKYNDKSIQIKIDLKKTSNEVIMKVLDNGIGIEEEYLNKIFEKFFRIPRGNTHNIKGYGLGLSYASMVMKMHGGSITVKNLHEGGCCFTLKLPIDTP